LTVRLPQGPDALLVGKTNGFALHFTEKAKVVVLLKVWPGRTIVEGKPG
jgi:hypothetical protein